MSLVLLGMLLLGMLLRGLPSQDLIPTRPPQ